MALHVNSQACASSSEDRDKPHLLSLPGETLKAIFEYVSLQPVLGYGSPGLTRVVRPNRRIWPA